MRNSMKIGILLVAIVYGSTIAATCRAASFESPGTVKAEDVVPEQLLSGSNHKLVDTVLTNGIQNQYRIETKHGQFEADGVIELRVRIREADALAYLDAVSKTDVFISALKDAGINSAKSVVSAVTKPVQTVKGLPSGIQKVFSGYVQGAKRGVVATKRLFDGESESGVLDPKKFKELNYVVSTSERKWASELSVDPYSTNMELRAAISSIAIVQFMGALPLDIALPVTASLAIGMLGELGDQIYSINADELETSNRACLDKAGLSSSQIDGFFDADYLTPTMHTIFCSAISRLSGESLGLLSEQLATSESFPESHFLLQTLSLLSWYQGEVGEIETLIANDGLPYAITRNRELLVMTPTDYLLWTNVNALRIDHMSQVAKDKNTGQKSIWIMGQASDRARSGLAGQNWNLHDRTSSELMASIYEVGTIPQHQ